MTTIVTREVGATAKGSPLTNAEVDANFTNLNTDKSEKAANLSDLTDIAQAKTNLGLGNVTNTADIDKPVSTAQQTALNLKADLASPALTGAPTAPTATAGTNTTQLATTAFVTAAISGVSGAAHTHAIADVSGLQTALDGKQAVDAAFKKSVRAATTANIALSAPQTIDGIALVVGDRVLVKNQTTTAQNGIYLVQAAAWIRATDADTATKIAAAIVGVESGTVNGGQRFATSFKTVDVLGTTAMTWARVLDAGMASASGGSAPGTAVAGTSLNYARQDHVHPLQTTVSGNAGSATILATGRTIGMTGDVTWTSGAFNGSAAVTGTATLANSGVIAGTYNNSSTQVQPFTVDAKGRITSVGAALAITPAWDSIANKPTSLAGYGITDAPSKGRLLAVRVFGVAETGTVYTPTPGTGSVVVKAVGAGGGGGGCLATTASQYSYGVGGQSGLYGEAYFSAAFSGVTLTVGVGGTTTVGGNGGAGGTTSFGTLLVCPGGGGGVPLTTVSTSQPSFYGANVSNWTVTGANIFSHPGFFNGDGLSNGAYNTSSSGGCSSYIGGGGGRVSLNNAGLPAHGYGGGGGGACNGVSNAARAGGIGGNGLIIVYEYAT